MQLSCSFSSAGMLINVHMSRNPIFKTPIRKENQKKHVIFIHSFRIFKAFKLETRDLHSLKAFQWSFFIDFEGNEVWFLDATTHLLKRSRLSVCRSVRRVGPSVIRTDQYYFRTTNIRPCFRVKSHHEVISYPRGTC